MVPMEYDLPRAAMEVAQTAIRNYVHKDAVYMVDFHLMMQKS